jgi:orotate phosphoribosyltransferase
MWYDHDYFVSQTLRKHAKAMLRQIKLLNYSGAGINTLLSRGASGCSIASAILALSDMPLYHTFVRKPHESAHGKSDCAGVSGRRKCVIVDDLISTGETIRNILNYAETRHLTVVAILVASCDSWGQETFDDIPIYKC